VDLTFEYATLPLYKGWAGGQPVWYVITDVSDASIARKLRINHAPEAGERPEDVSRPAPRRS
jgi:hypothetical protein